MEPNGRKWGAIVMLMGEYNHTIDAKGRLIVPAKFREVLGDEFVVTKGLDNCLFVYPNDEWQKFEEKLQTLPLTNKNARQFTRFFLAGAASVEVDKQGRILLPSVLREFAGLEKDVVFAEVDVLKEMGVEFKFNVEVGKDITIEELRKEGKKVILERKNDLCSKADYERFAKEHRLGGILYFI